MEKDVLLLNTDQIEYIIVLVESGGVVPLDVTGTSMRPFLLQKGETVYLERVNKDEIKKGMILLFKRDDNSVVLHRVRKIKGDTYVMNGDAQNWCEEITYDNVIAKVIEYTHKGKRIKPQSKKIKIQNALWYPTYIARPYLFAIKNKLKK